MPPPEPRTGAVLLAAGQAKRFDGGKLMAEFRGRPLWERAARTAEAIDFSERVVVIEPDSPIGSRLGWVRVENQFAMQGMGTSIAAGVRALVNCDRVIVMLADMPLVSRAHLERLIAAQGVAFTRITMALQEVRRFSRVRFSHCSKHSMATGEHEASIWQMPSLSRLPRSANLPTSTSLATFSV